MMSQYSPKLQTPQKYQGTLAEEFLDIESEDFDVSDESYKMLYDILEDADRKIDTSDQPEDILGDIDELLKEDYGLEYGGGTLVSRKFDYGDSAVNCFGYSVLFQSIGEALNLPISTVRTPEHRFVRYEGKSGRVNWETTIDENQVTSDAWYIEDDDIHEDALVDSDYMESQSREEFKAYAYNRRALKKEEEGNLEDALEDLDHALELNPDSPALYNNRGRIEHKLGMTMEAAEDYTLATSHDPRHVDALMNDALLAKEVGAFEDALEIANRVIDLDNSLESVDGEAYNVYEFRDEVREKVPDKPDRARAERVEIG